MFSLIAKDNELFSFLFLKIQLRCKEFCVTGNGEGMVLVWGVETGNGDGMVLVWGLKLH